MLISAKIQNSMYQDFTLATYQYILEKLLAANYQFQTFAEFITNPGIGKTVILRHDVDRAPYNAIKMANIEKNLKVKASYYFRIVDESYDEYCIKSIVEIGHELGYHYEDFAMAQGNKELAFATFQKNLEIFRQFYPIKTMCMHGSPMSQWDNRLLWKSYNYKDFEIIAEPYFDLDFNQIFYITDASRTWNNEQVTVRDKVKSNFDIPINSSKDMIHLLNKNKMPDRLMLSTHPHNWADKLPEWIKIKVWQGIKNQVKKVLVNKA
jgi:hypothetical protein